MYVRVQTSLIYDGTQYPDESSFTAIENFVQNDGDTSLFFLLANGVRYSEVVDDDWYAAHQIDHHNMSLSFFTAVNESEFLYLADEWASGPGNPRILEYF